MARSLPGTEVRRQRQRGSIPRPSAKKLLSPADWLASPEGRKVLNEALKQVDESEQRLAEARRVSFEDLHRPMTISAGSL